MKKTTLLLTLGLAALLIVGCQPVNAAYQAPFIETGIDPDSWVTIPAGEFLSGQEDVEVMVDYDYEIMITNVTNAQYAEFLNAAAADGSIGFEGAIPVGYHPGDPFQGYKHEEEILEGMYELIALDDAGVRIALDGDTYASLPAYINHPVTLVTWFGANAYCQYYDWQLPTEIEWEKAARGVEDNRPFPWGEEVERNYANYYSSHDLFEKMAGKSDTTPVGFYNGQTYEGYETHDHASPYGLYDMAGNVWQWVGDDYEDQHYRYLRGGSKESYAVDLRVWKRNSAGPEYFSPNVGFRCARD